MAEQIQVPLELSHEVLGMDTVVGKRRWTPCASRPCAAGCIHALSAGDRARLGRHLRASSPAASVGVSAGGGGLTRLSRYLRVCRSRPASVARISTAAAHAFWLAAARISTAAACTYTASSVSTAAARISTVAAHASWLVAACNSHLGSGDARLGRRHPRVSAGGIRLVRRVPIFLLSLIVFFLLRINCLGRSIHL